MRISTKLTVLVASALVVFVAMGSALVAYEEIEFAEARSAVHGVLLGRVVASSARETWERRGEAGAREVIAAIDAHEPTITVRWVDVDGTAANVPTAGALDTEQRAALAAGRIVTRARPEGHDARYTYVPIEGTGRGIEIAESLAARDEHVRSMLSRLAAFVLVGLAASLTLAWLLGRRIVGAPVARLAAITERVGAGDLGVRAPEGSDELGRLGEAMNRMIADLEEARAHIAREQEIRREAESQLRHAERLSTLGQLAAGVAHEVGTPLQSIMMRAELIEEIAGDRPELARHVEGIRAQCEKARDIAQSLLRFGRRSEARTGRVDLAEAARDALDLVRAAYPKAERIEVDLPDEPLPIEGDRDQLAQVVTNLLVNALHASEGGVGVRLEARRHEDGAARLRVHDRGSGMPREVLAHLFEPFFTTKAAGEGTGLGLPIAYGIVRDHGGRIEVDSEEGVGSRFDVVLPLAQEERAGEADGAEL